MSAKRHAFHPLIALTLIALIATAVVANPLPAQADKKGPWVYLPLLLKAPAVYVLSNHFLLDKGDEILVYGEVQNAGTEVLTLVKVLVDFYDAAGQLIGSDHSYVRLDNLPPNDRSCFKIWLMKSEPYPTNWQTYRLRTSTYWPDGLPLPALTVVSQAGKYYAGDTSYRLTGKIRNDESVSLRRLHVVATEYDSQNRVLNCDDWSDLSGTLAPGQTRDFLMLSFGSYLAGVTSYRLQTDAVRQP